MNRLLTLGASIMAAFLTGCASVPETLPASAAAGMKRTAVVSVAAKDLTRLHVGVTIFGNEFERRSVATWGLDKAYEEQVGAVAGKLFGSTVIPVDYPTSEFVLVNQFKSPFGGGLEPNWEAIERPVRDLCAAHRLDGVFVVIAQPTTDPFSYGSHLLFGAGIFTQRMQKRSVLYLLASIALMDCRDGKVLAVRPVVKKPDSPRSHSHVFARLPDEVSRIPTSQWTPEIESDLRRQMLSLPQDAWSYTLGSMLPSN